MWLTDILAETSSLLSQLTNGKGSHPLIRDQPPQPDMNGNIQVPRRFLFSLNLSSSLSWCFQKRQEDVVALNLIWARQRVMFLSVGHLSCESFWKKSDLERYCLLVKTQMISDIQGPSSPLGSPMSVPRLWVVKSHVCNQQAHIQARS